MVFVNSNDMESYRRAVFRDGAGTCDYSESAKYLELNFFTFRIFIEAAKT
jgi:hypothetical protein